MSTLTANGQTAVYVKPASLREQAGKQQTGQSRQTILQQVYDAHVEQIYKFVYFKIGNREDAEDITSQVFMKAANSLDVTQEEQTRLAWLYQVARTTITDHWRFYYKNPAASLEQMEEAAPLHLAANPLRPGATDDEEVSPATTHVAEILAKLSPNYRRVLELRFLQGCSLKETAQAMGVTEGNAKVLQHRALHKAVTLGASLM
ncbi:MAG TPA: RNA polymerase sigma factor [Chloroflexia bacterium]|jgi:RNA polymerase sigma-70 factor (ECF subfamily)